MLPGTLEKIFTWARDVLIHLYYSSEVPSWIADCSIPSLGEGNIESPHLNSKTYEPANKGRHLREKRDYVGKIPKRRTPPPVWEFSHFFTVFVKLVMPFYKLRNWKKR